MKLRKARENIGKTQQLVATEAGMSVAGYRKLEAGGVRRPAATTVHGVSQSVGVDPHEIDEFDEVLAGYEVVGGTQVAHQTAAPTYIVMSQPGLVLQPEPVPPDVEETCRRYETNELEGEPEGDLLEDEALQHEIEVIEALVKRQPEIQEILERQRRLLRGQQEIFKQLAVLSIMAAQRQVTKGT